MGPALKAFFTVLRQHLGLATALKALFYRFATALEICGNPGGFLHSGATAPGLCSCSGGRCRGSYLCDSSVATALGVLRQHWGLHSFATTLGALRLHCRLSSVFSALRWHLDLCASPGGSFLQLRANTGSFTAALKVLLHSWATALGALRQH